MRRVRIASGCTLSHMPTHQEPAAYAASIDGASIASCFWASASLLREKLRARTSVLMRIHPPQLVRAAACLWSSKRSNVHSRMTTREAVNAGADCVGQYRPVQQPAAVAATSKLSKMWPDFSKPLTMARNDARAACTWS